MEKLQIYQEALRLVKEIYSLTSRNENLKNEVVAQLQVISLVYGINTTELQDLFKILGRKINAFSRSF
jgi:ADP-dependent phosphofructokinase/glucokinase